MPSGVQWCRVWSPILFLVFLLGVVIVSIDLLKTDINQCSGDDSFFSDTHKCHIHSTQCQPIVGLGFRRGSYTCRCRDGFYMPNKNKTSSASKPSTASIPSITSGESNSHARANFFHGTTIEEAFVTTLVGPTTSESLYPQNFICVPCEAGCRTCADETPCFVQFNIFLRAITLGIQSFCATITFMVAIAVCKLRRHKRLRVGRELAERCLAVVSVGSLTDATADRVYALKAKAISLRMHCL